MSDIGTTVTGDRFAGLGDEFAELTRSLLAATTIGGVLQHLVTAAVRVIPAASLVSITLRGPDGLFYTPVETDPVAAELDQVQYRTGQGPCLDAARPDGPAHAESQDLAHEPAWPRFGPAAAERGMGSMLAIALLPDVREPRMSGALNVYAREAGALTAADRDLALLLATHGSLALANTSAVTATELEKAHLRKAIDSRDVIGQAKGILMQRRGITADEAFDLLRRTSQDLNVKLAVLAETLTSRHTELDLPGPSA
ncbi:GAF and ANTAR domain-containing protein [Amycolatopsis rhabdoformis]|uniref:GAF and ANTAR domain-containing protein n=1 Tax=Amycolatopsis rhabdoformis TaxID=1448059 RepID=A0ABZ1IH64_9PSEU|nr:GAF and ANTAR domain-containing protein [Amycolatopsis rhabdoformis]WSE33459.1 GAF and ANTAR domain-containing protein [Amycolatopsis rhabdoformis]